MNRNSLLVTLVLLVQTTYSVAEVDEKQTGPCFSILGCFPIEEPWTSTFRPGLLFPGPVSPEEIDTNLHYFSRKYDGKDISSNGIPVQLWPEISLKAMDFDGKRQKTYFITHGFWASGNSTWMSKMKDALLSKDDANVFLVDWGKGAETINYFQAASNTRVVGAELSRFVRYLINEHNLNPKNIHLIGHSLGAHISSYIGKNITGIGRLTALDPAQPGFEGTNKIVRLDKTDADFVDVLHTNCRPTIPTLGFGMISAVGHVDVYFNGGLDQPGCITPNSVPFHSLSDLAAVPFKALGKLISCSHSKAVEYFTASLNSKCKIWARQAGRIRSIINAVSLGNIEPITAAVVQCAPNKCTAVGYETPKFSARGMFAATTLKHHPFCDSEDPDYDNKVLAEIYNEDSKKIFPDIVLAKTTTETVSLVDRKNDSDEDITTKSFIKNILPFQSEEKKKNNGNISSNVSETVITTSTSKSFILFPKFT